MAGPSLFALLSLTGCVREYLFDRLQQPIFAPMAPVSGVGSLSAAACAGCHLEIAEEWRGSHMAMAWSDPVFQADWQESGQLYLCLYCHTPLVDQRATLATGLASLKPIRAAEVPNPSFDASLQAEGVTCVSCHVKDGAIVGPLDIKDAPHPIRVDPEFASADRCVSCHQADAPPLTSVRRPIADTHGEWERWQKATGRTETCTDCHMPAVERELVYMGSVRKGRRHTFPGAWDADFARTSLAVSQVVRTAAGVSLTLTNLTGHNLPTADPMRALRVELVFNGSVIASTLLERVIRTPAYAEERDTTLLPGEARVIRLPLAKDATGPIAARVILARLYHTTPAVQATAVGDLELWTEVVPDL